MIRNRKQNVLCRIVENLDLAGLRGISGVFLTQHLNHHIVCGFVYKWNQHILIVDLVGSICILRHGGFTYFPHKIPCEGFWKGVSKLFHIGFIYIAGFCGAHERQCIIVTGKRTLL